MAEETISTRIVANADFSALIADVHKVTASLSKLQEQLANSNKMLANQISVMNRSFSDTLRSTGQFSTHFVSLQSDVEKFGKNLDGGKLKLNQYFNTFRDHAKTSGGLIRELAKQQVALQNAILQPLGRNSQGLMQFNVHVPRGLDNVKNKTAIARQELQIYNKVIQDGAVQLINWGKNTQWAGRQLTVGLTIPLAAFGKAAADAFRMADQELTRLTKVYGDVAGTSATELSRVRKEVELTAKELSSAMGVNFRETIGLAADIAATGKTGNELLGSISETTRLAVLGEVDRQEAMKATLAIQSAFKSNTDELSKSINFLNAVENQTSTTLNDLVEAIPKAGPVIKGLGGSVQDLALYLTAMREGGVSASEGANALKSALASLINPTDVAVAKFQGFGIDLLGIVQKNAGNVTGTLFELQAALDRLDPLQKQQAIEQLFGKFQFSRLNALFENLGRQGSQTLQVMDLMKRSSSELAAVADRELAAVTESASGRYRRAVEGLRAELAGIGEQFLSINTTLINVVQNIVEFINKLPGPVKQALTFLGGLTAVAGPLIMLTGVLANFFGYILKGVGHMKAFFRGGEGWKYLTPEMLAAEKAGKLVEQTFYSDAKAASVLQMALKNLIDEFAILEGKSRQAVVPVGPAISTIGGNVVAGSAQRVVDPNNPFAGAPYTRASTHMVPRSGMTDEQRMQQTIFGLVPGAIPVNRKIGDNPQIYMNEPLPNIPGLTSINNVSTGVVSGEAAKWHAMMATLGMQSKQEIQDLRQQIIATGTVSKDFMNTFDDILPAVKAITDNAASQSAAIVAELRAGKINLEQAKQQIIALNLETERIIGTTVSAQAAAMGKTINLTQVPTLDQPVVDPTGKSNMRELFKKSKTRDFVDKIARALGVRTSGAGYNIETTKPKKFNSGNLVPGSGNTDTVPAMLTPGEFVINKEATARNLPLLMEINSSTRGGVASSSRGNYGVRPNLGQVLGGIFRRPENRRTLTVRGNPLPRHYWSTRTGADVNARRNDLIESHDAGWKIKHPDGRFFSREELQGLSKDEVNMLWKDVDRSHMGTATHRDADGFYFLPALFGPQQRYGAGGNLSLRTGGNPQEILRALNSGTMHPFSTMRSSARLLGYPSKDIDRVFGEAWKDMSMQLRTRSKPFGKTSDTYEEFAMGILQKHLKKLKIPKTNTSFFDEMMKIGTVRGGGGAGSVSSAVMAGDETISFRNNGGMIYMNSGGMVPGVQYLEDGGGVQGFRSGFQSQAGTPGNRRFFGSGLFKSDNTGMRGMAMGMGMGFAGQAIGGDIGNAIQMASIIPMLAPNMLSKTFNGLKGVATALTTTGKAASLAGKALGLAFRALPFGAAIGGILAVGAAIKYLRAEAEKRRKEEVAGVGITKQMSEEAKLKNINLSDSIKSVTEQLKLQRAAGLAAYEAYTQSGIPQLTLTIKELKAAQKEARETMKESVNLFNNADPSDVIELAQNLKTEYIAGGMSVQEATNKIYALISVSNKAKFAVSAVANEGFVAITDASTAADLKIRKLAEGLTTVDAEGLASGIDSMVVLLDMSMNKLKGTKDEFGNVIDAGAALESQFDKISNAGGTSPIGEMAMQNLLKIRPELEGVINSADTLESIYAKWRIQLSGAVVNLKNLTAEQAKSLALVQAAGQQAMDQAKESGKGGILGASQKVLDGLNKSVKRNSADSRAAFEQAQKNYEKELELIEKKIKKINEEAEARKKALEDQQRSEDTKLEIQKAQLDYQNKIAAGDMAGAAAAQLRIKQLVNERENQKAIDSIEENRAKRVKAEEAKADRIRAMAKKKEEAQASVVSSASRAAEQRGIIQDLQSKYEGLISRQNSLEFIKDKDAKEKERKSISGGINQLSRDIAAAGAGNTQFSKILAEAFPGLVAINEKSKKLESRDQGTVTQAAPDILGGKVIPAPKITLPSGAETAFASDAAKIKSAAEAAYDKLGDGKTLRDVVDAILNGPNAKQAAAGIRYTTKAPLEITEKYETRKDGVLTDDAKRAINEKYKLVKGDYYTYGGRKYRVIAGKMDEAQAYVQPLGRATFGRVVPGRGYMVGERGPEFFKTDVPGNIQPYYNLRDNAKMNTMFQKGSTSIQGGNNNQVFNFYFEEAPKNAKELFTEFKKLVGLERSRSGGSVVYGGRY